MQINKHNHRLSEHLYKSYSESRVVIDDELVVPGAQRMKDEAVPASPSGTSAADAVEHHLSAPVAQALDDHALKSTGGCTQLGAVEGRVKK